MGSTFGGANAYSYDFKVDRCFASIDWLFGLLAVKISCLTYAMSSSIS
jgi:hypothetical protein